VEGYKGKQVELPISLNNQHDITAFQFDLYLPTGVTVAKKSNGKMMIETTERMEGSYTISSNTIDNFVRVAGYSGEGDFFTGNSGDILKVTLDIAETVADGDYTISLKETVLSDVNNTEYHPADAAGMLTVKSYTLGDVDNSGAVNINDVVCIINHILNRPISVFIAEAADVDGSGTININDVVTLINRYILMNSNAPRLMDSAPVASTADANFLHIADFEIAPGETRELQVLMTNVNTVAAVQGNIKLPEGMSFVTDSEGQVYAESNDTNNDNIITACGLQSDESLTFTQYSYGGNAVNNSNGRILTFKAKADTDVTKGSYNVFLSNVVLSIDEIGYTVQDRQSVVKVSDTTGLNLNEANQSFDVYSLTGQKIRSDVKTIEDMPKGIYIINGKTVIIK